MLRIVPLAFVLAALDQVAGILAFADHLRELDVVRNACRKLLRAEREAGGVQEEGSDQKAQKKASHRHAVSIPGTVFGWHFFPDFGRL